MAHLTVPCCSPLRCDRTRFPHPSGWGFLT
ncbi:hypothetical protein [Curvibacter phage PCA1]|nr:hypothetical protein [Curvibacter phage PCA1]